MHKLSVNTAQRPVSVVNGPIGTTNGYFPGAKTEHARNRSPASKQPKPVVPKG